MNQGKWIPVNYGGVGYPMPTKDCDIWIARGNAFGDGWIQKVKYFARQGFIEWHGTFAYQVVNEGELPSDFIMRFAGNKEIVCKLEDEKNE